MSSLRRKLAKALSETLLKSENLLKNKMKYPSLKKDKVFEGKAQCPFPPSRFFAIFTFSVTL